MADHAKEVETRLKAVTAVTDLCGQRIWQGQLPQEQEGTTYLPAVVIRQISGVSEYVFGQMAGIVELTMQIDAYALTYAACEGLREQIKAALQQFKGTPSAEEITFVGVNAMSPTRTPESKIWRGIQVFTLWGTE